VQMMLEWLEAQPRDKVLDIGSGSGWSTALLAHIVGPKGKVYAVEKIPELVDFGRDNCQRAGVKNAEFFQVGKALGLPKYAPYDRVLVSAAAKEFPEELVEQLKVGGKLVIPVRNDILEIEKESSVSFTIKIHPGFVFVPLV
jgi:protein-L-isoaspartate(D-aspartate) O-methyltransferase